ncbi:DUF6777 domain-containing protein [Kitasatospora sp. NPDC052868]|uniref:DUF6777 domain-containing protein n=1 Tax=Kitasatospora sp. NPDC052868 TaxID=3364060 RepID=UPI0037C9B51A
MATVLIVNNNGSKSSDAIPAANEVALQSPSDPGAAPFTESVETTAVSAPAPSSVQPTGTPGGGTTGTTATAGTTSPSGLHAVEGTSSGLYAGEMSKPSCDTERLIGMVSAGDNGRAWASAQGIQQSAIPSYLRSLTSTYLRVDTRVTNHGYKGGAAVAYQSVLQAGTAVLVDSQGVPRVRCSCGNPLKPPALVSNAKYTGKHWQGFQPTSLVVVTPAPAPVKELVLVNVVTGGFFVRVTGRIEVIDKTVPAPKGPLAPGIPAPAPMTPISPSASVSRSTSASGSTSGSGSPSTSGATTSSGGPTSGSASASTTSGSPSGPSSGSTTSSGGPTTSASTATGSSGPTTTAAKPTTSVATTASMATTTKTTAAGATTTTTTTTTTSSPPPSTVSAGSSE